MLNKTLATLLAGSTLLLASCGGGSSDNSSNTPATPGTNPNKPVTTYELATQPYVSIEQGNIDFSGSNYVGLTNTKELTITNTGTEAETINSISGLPGNITPSGCIGSVLKPLESCTITLTYKPTTTEEKTTNKVTVDATGKDGKKTSTTVDETQDAVEPIKLSSSSATLNNYVGFTQTTTVTINNVANQAITLDKTIANLPSDVTATGCLGKSLAAGSGCEMTFSYKPTAATNSASLKTTSPLIISAGDAKASFTLNLTAKHSLYIGTLDGLAISTKEDTNSATRNWQHIGYIASPEGERGVGFLSKLLVQNGKLYVGMSEGGHTSSINTTDFGKPQWTGYSDELKNFSHIPTTYDISASSNNQDIYIATAGGLSYSFDGGSTWQTANSKTPGFGPDNEVIKVTANANYIIAATRGGVSIYTIATKTWAHYDADTTGYSQKPQPHQLLIKGNTLYVVTNGGISSTSLASISWSTLTIPELPSWASVYSYQPATTQDGTAYIGTSVALYSDKSGAVTQVTLPTPYRYSIKQIYRGSQDGYPIILGTTAGIFVKENATSSWTNVYNQYYLTSMLISNITVDGTSKPIIVIGYFESGGINDKGYEISTDLGKTWQKFSNAADNSGLSSQVDEFAIDSQTHDLYAGDFHGDVAKLELVDGQYQLVASDKSSQVNIAPENSSLSPYIINLSILPNGANTQILFGSDESNSYSNTNGQAGWGLREGYVLQSALTPLYQFTSDGENIGVNQGLQNSVTSKAATLSSFYQPTSKSLFAITDDAVLQFADNQFQTLHQNPYPGDAKLTSMLQIGSLDILGLQQGIMYTTDNGNTWKGNTLENSVVNKIKTNSDHSNIYIATNKGLFIMSPDLISERFISGDTLNGKDGANANVLDVKISGSGATTQIYARLNNGIAISNDNGNTWQIVNDTTAGFCQFPESIFDEPLPGLNMLAISGSGDNTDIYVTCSDGLATSSNNGKTWSVIKPSTVNGFADSITTTVKVY